MPGPIKSQETPLDQAAEISEISEDVEQASTSRQAQKLLSAASKPGAVVVNVTKGINAIVDSIIQSSCSATQRDREQSLELSTRLKEAKEKQIQFSKFHSIESTEEGFEGPTHGELLHNFNNLVKINEEALSISSDLAVLNMSLLGRLQKQQSNIRKGITLTFNKEIQKYQESVLLVMLKKKEQQNASAKQEIEILKLKIKHMNEGLQKRGQQLSEFKKYLDKCFTNNQIKYLLDKNSDVHWTKDEIHKANTIKAYSQPGYLYLRNELNYPLPDFEYLRRASLRDTSDDECERVPTEQILIKEEQMDEFEEEQMDFEEAADDSLIENVRFVKPFHEQLDEESVDEDIIDDIKIEYEDIELEKPEERFKVKQVIKRVHHTS